MGRVCMWEGGGFVVVGEKRERVREREREGEDGRVGGRDGGMVGHQSGRGAAEWAAERQCVVPDEQLPGGAGRP